MHILCPHCRNPIEVVKLTPEEILCPGCGSSFRLETQSTAAWTPADGERKLGRFVLMDAVGVGAFGTVYKARDPELERTVAIKVPRAGNLPGREDAERFLREARSVANLRHASIVPIHEVGQADGVPYLVSEFVEGVTLADLLSARRPPPHEAAQLIATVADALHYAHQQGVVHRDVKPSNIMLESGVRNQESGVRSQESGVRVSSLTPDSRLLTPRLMDFGLAKRDAGEITMTVEGQVLGTPAYMSPEQARGEAHQVDGRGDVYSLGVILYQMLTGELPFRGTTRMLLHQVLHDAPRPPRRLNERIPRDLETICLKAMAKEPPRRYQSAGDLAADLRRFLKDEPIQARRTSTVERLQRWCRRNPLVASLLAAVAMVTALGFAGTLLQMRVAQDNADVAGQQRDEAQQANATLKKMRDEQQATLYVARLNLVPAAWEAGNVRRVLELLEQTKPAAGENDRRGFEWHYWNRLCHAETRSHKLAPSFLAPAFSGDGTRIADISVEVVDKQVHMWLTVWDTATAVRRLHVELLVQDGPVGFNAAGFHEHVQLSRDGSRVAVLPPPQQAESKPPLQVWDVKAAKKIAEFPRAESFVLSQGGDKVALAFQKKEDRVIAGKKKVQDVHSIQIWKSEGGGKPIDVDLHGRQIMGVGGLAFSPDAKQLAGWWVPSDFVPDFERTTDNFPGEVWDAGTGQRLSTFQWAGGGFGSAAFTPDGTRLAVAATGENATETLVLVEARTGKEVQKVPMNGSLIGFSRPAFSADGKFLTCYGLGLPGETAVQVWNVGAGWKRRTLRGHRAGVRAVAFDSSDQLWTATADGTVYQWNATAEAWPPGLLSEPGSTFEFGLKVAINQDCTRLLVARNIARELRFKFGVPPIKATRPPRITVLDFAGKVLRVFEEHRLPVADCEFDPSGVEVVSLGLERGKDAREAELLFWNSTTGKVRLKVVVPIARQTFVGPLVLSGDGQRLAVVFHRFGQVAGIDATMQVRDVATGKELLTSPELKGYWFTEFSSDGKWLVGFGAQSGVKVWNLSTGKEQWSAQAKDWRALRAVFTPSGAQLAVSGIDPISGRADLRLYDPATGQELRKLRTLNGKLLGGLVQFSADDKWLALVGSGDLATDEGVVRVLDADTWEQRFVLRIPSGNFAALAFTPDSKRLATSSSSGRAGDGSVKLWDLATGQELLSLPHTCEGLRFSPDGHRLAGFGTLSGMESVSQNSMPKVWDATPLPK